MERGVFMKRLQGGLKEWPGVQIILDARPRRRHLVELVRSVSSMRRLQRPRPQLRAQSSTPSSSSIWLPTIAPSARTWPTAIQREILENYYFVPVFRHASMQAIGPRIAARKWQDVFPTITTAYAYPWEDIAAEELALSEPQPKHRRNGE